MTCGNRMCAGMYRLITADEAGVLSLTIGRRKVRSLSLLQSIRFTPFQLGLAV
jgi:hypothetical protein